MDWIESFWDESIMGRSTCFRSKRQPGSTIKPFLYASQFMGYEPPTILYDSAHNLEGNEKKYFECRRNILGGIRMTDALQSRVIFRR